MNCENCLEAANKKTPARHVAQVMTWGRDSELMYLCGDCAADLTVPKGKIATRDIKPLEGEEL
jgi:hypothetical protein